MIRNLRNPADLQKAIMTQDELLKIAIANENNIANARKAVKYGEIENLPVEDRRTKDELLQDENYQIQEGQKNLQDLGFKFDEATEIINKLGVGGAITINQSYPTLKKMFLSTYNVKTTTAPFFIQWFKQYESELTSSKGLTFGNASKLDALTDNVNDLKKVIPSKKLIYEIRSKMQTMGNDAFRYAMASKKELLDKLDEVYTALPSETLLQQLETNSLDSQITLNYIQNLVKAFPTREQLLNIVKETNNKEAVEKVEKLLTGFTVENTKQLEQMAKELEKTREDTKQAMGEIKDKLDITEEQIKSLNMKLTDDFNLLTPTEFNLLGVEEQDKYIGVLKQKNYISMDDFLVKEKNSKKLKLNKKEKYEEYKQLLPLIYYKITNSMGSSSKSGSGLRTKKMMIGRGVSVYQDTPKYKEFGKYAIHWNQLMNNDILNVKYKSLGRIPTLLPVAISDVFKDFIIDVVETGKINNRLYEMVNPEEKKYFEKLCIGAGLLQQFKLKKTVINEEMEDIKRFNILKGEYLAGNNNSQLIKELRKLIIKFINSGRIHKSEGLNLLMELST